MKNEIRWLLQEKYKGKMTAAAKRDIMRLEAGEPIDYVIGFTEFLGCKIYLDKKPLIPRVETEFWTEQAISYIAQRVSRNVTRYKLHVLDIFSGSGAIGIAVAKQLKNAHVTFADSEKNCVEQIKINCAKNKLPKSSYAIVQSDVFDQLTLSREKVKQFDYIFANPPYIPKKRAKKVQESVKKHEPAAALWGGEDGVEFIERFLTQAPKFLHTGGKIFMEFDPQQKLAIAKLAKKAAYSKTEFHKDQYGKTRWITVFA